MNIPSQLNKRHGCHPTPAPYFKPATTERKARDLQARGLLSRASRVQIDVTKTIARTERMKATKSNIIISIRTIGIVEMEGWIWCRTRTLQGDHPRVESVKGLKTKSLTVMSLRWMSICRRVVASRGRLRWMFETGSTSIWSEWRQGKSDHML